MSWFVVITIAYYQSLLQSSGTTTLEGSALGWASSHSLDPSPANCLTAAPHSVHWLGAGQPHCCDVHWRILLESVQPLLTEPAGVKFVRDVSLSWDLFRISSQLPTTCLTKPAELFQFPKFSGKLFFKKYVLIRAGLSWKPAEQFYFILFQMVDK